LFFRYLRLGTASLANQGNDFIKVDKLDIKKMAKNEPVAIALCNYLLYVENNPKKALELAAECSNLGEYKNWWWKERLGKCYYLLGLYREAEKQF
jgi:tetratricopeptide repeat protein 8